MKRCLAIATVAGICALALVPLAAASAARVPRHQRWCTDPSAVCPPNNTGVRQHYLWAQCKCSGGSSEEFYGSSLPPNFVAANSDSSCSPPPYATAEYAACDGVPNYSGSSLPPDSNGAWFAPSQVTVHGGELRLSTSWVTADTDCNAYWGEAVLHTGAPTLGCWLSGSVGQVGGRWARQAGASEEFAFEARWSGNADMVNLDSSLQVASYPTWPPEVDVAETDYGGPGTGPGASFNSFVHCPATGRSQNVDGNSFSADGSPSDAPISTAMTGWHTYELDVSPQAITVYVDGQAKWTLNADDAWCTATIAGGAGDGGSSGDWVSGVGHALGAFMEAVMLGTGDPRITDHQTMLIDWVAEM